MTKYLFQTLSFVFISMPLLAQNLPRVQQERLEKTLFELAAFGKMENGETNRVAFSDADIAGRRYVMGLMAEAGLDVHIDAAANIIGRRDGLDPSKKPLAFGSHIDMVPHGGNYDGIVGSLAAIEVARTLNDQEVATQHPLEVIIFSNEEGGVMGSRALAGTLTPEALEVTNSTGFRMGQGIQRLGGDTTKIYQVKREPGSLAAFLELHIEQGALLDRGGIDIGVVEGIVGIKWWDVQVSGTANHAGTTPMDLRQDALLAASRFVIAVNEVALATQGRHVATVGRISAQPGAPNVIPGEVLLSLEIRDLSSEKIQGLFTEIQARASKIAAESGTSFTYRPIDATGAPALTDPKIRQAISEMAASLNLSYISLQSGAGHDAQEMAALSPVGMIFVPSKAGISHSPKEFTSAEDMANGANVLLRTLLALDRQWP